LRSLSSSSGDSAGGKRRKENKPPNLLISHNPTTSQSDKEEDQCLSTLIESLFQLFPDLASLKHKRGLTQDLQALLRSSSLYAKNFSQMAALRMEIKQGEQLRREQVHKNEEATKRISELEGKLQESERDRQRIRGEQETLKVHLHDATNVIQEKAKQEEII
jgi:hypothetical protein